MDAREQTTLLLLPVAHRLIGSLILGAPVALAVRVSGIEANHVRCWTGHD
jgi:hypothetical protein